MDPKSKLRSLLLERCVRCGSFTLSSGKQSDFYVDCKPLLLDAAGLLLCCELIFPRWRTSGAPFVGGKSVGADPLISGLLILAAREGLSRSGCFVRDQAKGHGTGKQIDGPDPSGQEVFLVDDVLTTGGSLLFAAAALRRTGATVKTATVIVDRQEGGREAMSREGITVEALFTRAELKS